MADKATKINKFWQRWTKVAIKTGRTPEEIETKLNKKFSKEEQKTFTDKIKDMKEYDDAKEKSK